jgi:hypothetical protein
MPRVVIMLSMPFGIKLLLCLLCLSGRKNVRLERSLELVVCDGIDVYYPAMLLLLQ